MSTRLAFSHAQKARHISVPTFSLSNMARPRLGGMASANVGESKVTREKKEVTRKKRPCSNESLQRANAFVSSRPTIERGKTKGCRLRECAEWPLRERNANISIIHSRGNSEKKKNCYVREDSNLDG
ncbi:hypothetical protein ALC53_10779 [Atta colombica]|uniref:Uncharacterized protein n=1 Tax=Atta colombica TaxID=520822 RepID=A0A195B381_9HYME|nr:hypothetical protein ALC53_10779 [Atta colombica]